jgi:hypothetical protein
MLELSNKMIDKSKLYVISVCSNPVRYKRRWELFQQFQRHMHDVEGNLISVEIGYGARFPQIIPKGSYTYEDPTTLLFQSNEELWHKENLINLALQFLTQVDPAWEGVCWIDGDVHFQRHDIIEETAHQLQHYDFVQMFSHALDLGPNLEPIRMNHGFVWAYHNNQFQAPQGAGYGGYYNEKGVFWHPGFAWAARRTALEKVQLLDKAILGAGDHHMALSLIGQGARSLPKGISKGYRDMVLQWQEQAEYHIRRNVGYVPGTITHYWHGSKKSRKYVERWKILIDNQYDPVKDISREPSGIYRLNMNHGLRSVKLRDQIRAYFRQRNEDCTYVED